MTTRHPGRPPRRHGIEATPARVRRWIDEYIRLEGAQDRRDELRREIVLALRPRWTAAEIGEYLGISGRRVSQIERGGV